MRLASQVQPPAHKELCFFSRFKRHLQRHRLSPASSWPLYVTAFEGATALAERKRMVDPRARRFGGHRGVTPWAESGRRLSSSLQCEAARRLSFEACPFYLGEAWSAGAIRATFPSLKLIAVLRNPRDRTVSAFNDYVRVGRIRGRNASAAGMEAVVAEKARNHRV